MPNCGRYIYHLSPTATSVLYLVAELRSCGITPSSTTISRLVSRSAPTVDHHLKRLEWQGYLTSSRHLTVKGRHEVNEAIKNDFRMEYAK